MSAECERRHARTLRKCGRLRIGKRFFDVFTWLIGLATVWQNAANQNVPWIGPGQSSALELIGG